MKITKGLKLVIAGGVLVGASMAGLFIVSMVENTDWSIWYAVFPMILLLASVVAVVWGIIRE